MKAVINVMPQHWLSERQNTDAAQWDELWEGVLHTPPMPNTMHQDFEGSLAGYLRYNWARPNRNRVFQQINLALPNQADWTKNYRVPDILLLTPVMMAINRGSHFAGAPLVVVEIRSPDDETYEKLDFYAQLGVPEVWVIDRDTKAVELRTLVGSGYTLLQSDATGWLRSPATGVEFHPGAVGKVHVRVNGDDATTEELPEN